jgi:branched-chain amino acid transport system substrate-binding protein
LPLARYIFERYGKRVFMVGSDYIYPFESNRIMADLIEQAGGEVLGEVYVPLQAEAADFLPAIKEIAHSEPDAIFSTVVGRSTAIFYEQYHKAGFDPSAMPIASLTTSEAELAEMSVAAAAGHITAAPFFSTLDTKAANTFVASFRARFGAEALVTAAAEAAYFQVMLVAGAIDQTGTDDPEFVRSALSQLQFEAPQGLVRIDSLNNHTFLWPRVAKVNEQGQFEVVWDPGVRVKPDPYGIDQGFGIWADETQSDSSVQPASA